MTQGRPFKCPIIRELLWDWFVDVRRSLATKISPKFMIMKARSIADSVLKEQRKVGVYEEIPDINKAWLFRFRRDKGISFRKPNMRYKCSKVVLLARIRAMWANVFRIRRLGERFADSDFADRFYGVDEKPLHFNENGSKATRTLEIEGAPSVRLKENHAATRERCSLMTMVTSSPAMASSPALVPVEVLFKAQSPKRTRSLVVPLDLRFTVQWAPKGSYREEHILRYLEKVLDPWTADRLARKDYRVLMMDVAKSHISDAVTSFAWSRGYITLFHYGCTTGVCQVNDTDLHGPLEREFIEAEQRSFHHQQELLPGCVARRPQDVLDDTAVVWRRLDHGVGVAGHLRNGLTVKLDGSQDGRISREAFILWNELGMAEVRRAAIEEVDSMIDSGELDSIADWARLVRHPTDAGVLHEEGDEFEGELDEGEVPWLDDADAAREAAEEDEEGDDDDDGGDGGGPRPPLPPPIAEPDDDPDEVADATVAVERLEALRRLRADSLRTKCPSAVFSFDREITQLERGIRIDRGSSKAKAVANRVLRRTMEKAAAAEAAAMHAKRLENLKIRREALELKKAAAAAKKKAEAEALEKKRLKEAIAALPIKYTVDMLRKLTADGLKTRRDCLERLKLGSPKLPFELEHSWVSLRDDYTIWIAKRHKDGCGRALMDEVNTTLKELGSMYSGPSKFKSEPGDASAFLSFLKRIRDAMPTPCGVVM